MRNSVCLRLIEHNTTVSFERVLSEHAGRFKEVGGDSGPDERSDWVEEHFIVFPKSGGVHVPNRLSIPKRLQNRIRIQYFLLDLYFFS